jgi:arylamine N-acetyltransferase
MMPSIIETLGASPSFIENELLNPDLYRHAAEDFLRQCQIRSRQPDLELLSEILLHYSSLPYENLSKIIKHKNHKEWLEKIRLPGEVLDDHFRFHLGGTCFALTFTLETILNHLGYLCYPLMADMKWKPNSHCALIVRNQGDRYLVDPGYLLNRPMRLNVNRPRVFLHQISGVEVVYQQAEQYYHLYTFNRDQMKWRYKFRDIVCSRHDFLTYWLESYYWNSMHGLLLNKIEKGRMVYVHKTFMRETTVETRMNRNIKRDYHSSITGEFRIQAGKIEEALSALEVNLSRERELGLWVPKETGIKNQETRDKIKD